MLRPRRSSAWPADVCATFERIMRLAQQAVGLERMHEPYIKHLASRIWEMRLRGRDGIARILLHDGYRQTVDTVTNWVAATILSIAHPMA